MMRRQISPVMQAHAIRVKRGRLGIAQGGEEAVQQSDDGGHFVTSFRVASWSMTDFCAVPGDAAMDKVATAL